MKTSIAILFFGAIVSGHAMAADSTSLTPDNNVTAQANGGGGIMTGTELYKAAIGRSAKLPSSRYGTYSVNSDGHLYIDAGKGPQKQCNISSGVCTGGVYSSAMLPTYTIQPGGMVVTTPQNTTCYGATAGGTVVIPWQ